MKRGRVPFARGEDPFAGSGAARRVQAHLGRAVRGLRGAFKLGPERAAGVRREPGAHALVVAVARARLEVLANDGLVREDRLEALAGEPPEEGGHVLGLANVHVELAAGARL